MTINNALARGERVPSTFQELRYGLFIHFGLYSLIGRGEWVMNKEEISPAELRNIASDFSARSFDAAAIADLAVEAGMKYIVFTTMHHDGFRMYHSDLTEFCSTKTGSRRDFVGEIIAAARKRKLKIGLYHSLNNWFDQPDSVDALEDKTNYGIFLQNTFARIRELVTRYNPVDILWYDGWWPFDAVGWQAEKMNAMVREIQPHILFNGRNGLVGDFGTPEQHLSTPDPWRPWEACVTLNDSWGFHAGDDNWKSPIEVIKMLARVAQGNGNLLLNIGPRGDGSVPEESVQIIRTVGEWLRINGECIFDTELWTLDPQTRGEHRADWCNHGPFTAKGNNLYLIATSPPRDRLILTGVEARVLNVSRLDGGELPFQQCGQKLIVLLPEFPNHSGRLPPVFRIAFDHAPSLYKTGGMRTPSGEHPRYDPVPSDIAW